MIYQVNVAYIYKDDEQRACEQSIKQHFVAVDNADAIRCAIRWSVERSKSLDWDDPIAITIHPYYIASQEASGFIPTKLGFPFFEWKYDTSPYTIKQLIDRYKQQETP